MIPESAEVRREKWLRGDPRALLDRLPSRQWLRSKLPRDRQEWLFAIYLAVVLGTAGYQLIKEKIDAQRGNA